MFNKVEIKLISSNFKNVYIQDNLIYFTSKDTNHMWIIQKLKSNSGIIYIHHKRPHDLYYHKHCTYAKTVKFAVNHILKVSDE